MPHKMNRKPTLVLTALALALTAPLATATLISIDPLAGGVTPASLGGYTMSDFAADARTGQIVTSSSAAPGTGDIIDFAHQDMVTPLSMTVGDPWWWQYDHGNVYTVPLATSNYITLLLPENTRALSFWVGANLADGQSNNAWLQAYSGDYVTDITQFRVDVNSTQGFGVYSDDGCSAIAKIVIEPAEWGVGHFAINQGTCAEVPEPSSLSLFGAGLLILGFALRRRAAA